MKHLTIICVFLLNAAQAEDKWITLFNGRNLDGWTERNKSGSFRVEEGTIVGTAKEGLGTTFLCTNENYADFELEFECKVDPGLNSGVQIRSRNREPRGKQKVGPVEGPQVEIACKNPERGSRSGSIFGQQWGTWLTPKEDLKNHKFMTAGWNRFRVVAKGDQVTTWINGNEVITTTIPAERHETNSSGFIGLQIHGIKEGTGPFEVAWRNIRIRDLGGEKAEAPKPTSAEKTTKASVERIRLKHQGPETPFRKLPVFKDHQLTRFATAPEINCPVSVIAEPGGAVYALCDGNAGLGRLPNQGSVWRLVDEDDDGKADVATKFIPNIDTPRGGQFLNGTLYLVHPPFISAVRDTDGDGVADERKVLASGFAHDLSWTRGGDHSTNDLRVGIDGWIYVAVGDFGASAVGSDGSTAKLMTGGVIRMRLDGSDLEVYARGTRNTYDLAINHRLDILTMDNTNDGDGWDMRLHHLTPLAHMGYPNLYKHFSEDAMPPLFTYGGGSGCGALYLEEPQFPDWLNQRFQTISWGRMFTHDLTPHEATFTNKDQVLLSMNKLVDLDVDGSSRLYFANFEGGGARIDPGAIVGHIVQAKPRGWKCRPFPDLEKASPETLISFLDQGSGVLRQQAQWALIGSETEGVDEWLKKAGGNEALSLEARIAALFAINLRDGSGAVETLSGFLNDEALTEFALRSLLDRDDRSELGLETKLAALLEHKDPRVRLQAVVGVQKLGLVNLTEKLLEMAKEEPRRPLEKDVAHVHDAIPHTARRALIAMAPVDRLHKALDKSELRPAALAVLRQIHHADNVAKLMAALGRSATGEEKLDLVATLLRLYHREKEWDGNSWWGTRPNSAGPYYRGVAWEGSKDIAAALRKAVKGMDEKSQKEVLYQVRRHNLSLEELRLPIEVDPSEQLLEQPEHTFQQHPDLLAIMTDEGRPQPMRIKAFRAALEVTGFTYGDWCVNTIKALDKIAEEKELYDMLSREFVQSSSHRISMMQRVPKAFSKLRRANASQQELFFDVICNLVQSPLTTEKEKGAVVSGMAKNPMTPAFLASIREHRVTVFLPLLKKASKDKELGEEVQKVIAALKSSGGKLVGSLPQKEVIGAVLKISGSAEAGKQIFMRQACFACHSVLPDEPQKGPYLGTAGSQFNREQLITHVINPGAEVAQGFQGFSFTLKDGSTATGFVTSRDEKTIELRTIAGVGQKLSVAEVADETALEGSLMPPGLVDGLTLEEFASLIDYLQSLH